MNGSGRAEGGGWLDLSLNHPAATFLYGATRPRVRLDGVDIPVSGWGRHSLDVAPGRHRLEIWVPYVLPRKAGKVSREITVAAGTRIALEYMAPTITFARGSLGMPGEQKSAGHSAIMVMNIVAVVLVVVFCGLLALIG